MSNTTDVELAVIDPHKVWLTYQQIMILLRVCMPTGLMVCGTEMSRVISSVAIVLVCTGMLFALTVPSLTVHVKRGKNGTSKPNAGDAL